MLVGSSHSNAVRATKGASRASAPVRPPVYEVVKSIPSDTWHSTELIRDRDEIFKQQQFSPRTKHRDPEIVSAFGTDAPHSGDALLHYAGPPPAGVPKKQTPVLLIHGATKNGNFWWDPGEDGQNQGLPQKLRAEGHEVFALTFAHNQDDNFLWAEQIANAIAEIKKDTGAEQVDLVAHSKGGVPTRLYVSDVRREGVEATPYQGDVRRIVLVGAPNGGIDFSFRHPSANYALLSGGDSPKLNAPVSWERAIMYGLPQNVSEHGFSSQGPDYYPGQRQLLADLSKDHPLSPLEPDWYTTYHGGHGFLSYSKGIHHYIEEGENVIERLRQNPIPKEIEVAVVAGDAANIPGIVNEYTGPSDGLLFVSSALDLPEETNLIARDVLPLHHKALVSDPRGQQWITDALDRETMEVKQLDQVLQQAEQEWKAQTDETVVSESLAGLAASSTGGQDAFTLMADQRLPLPLF
jgi:triacylglycerol lipase